jgi:hypothetical protein
MYPLYSRHVSALILGHHQVNFIKYVLKESLFIQRIRTYNNKKIHSILLQDQSYTHTHDIKNTRSQDLMISAHTQHLPT